MTPADTSFLQKCIKRYYFERFGDIELPADMHMREFGYQGADSVMVRHMQLGRAADLRVLLLQAAPTDMYVSNARYMLPSMPMDDKLWQDADIIFDMDAKDLDLECRPSHTCCTGCGRVGSGACSCNARMVPVVCKKCMRAAGDQAVLLLKILADDFDIRDARVYFSGNEGFHVHMHDGELAKLDRAGRAELADYMALRGIIPERLAAGGKKPEFARRSDTGWRGRFGRALSKSDRARMTREIAAGVYSTRERVMHDMVGRLGVRVDAGVTMDVHRIFRMPGTINGKSGMAKTPCMEDPKAFDMSSAVVIHDDPVCVRASCMVRFSLKGRRFGPYTNEYVDMPAYAAAYLVCKGLAHVVACDWPIGGSTRSVKSTGVAAPAPLTAP